MWGLNTKFLLLLLVSSWCNSVIAQFHDAYSQQALFIRDIDAPSPYNEPSRHSLFDQTSDRVLRQSSESTNPTTAPGSTNMDQTVQGILEWLQGKYANARKARQEGPARQYLPSRIVPTTTQKPRPFQTSNDFQSFLNNDGGSAATGYPYPQPPNPSFNIPETLSSYTPSPIGSTNAPYNPSSTGGSISPYGGSSGSSAAYNPSSLSPSQGSPQDQYNPTSTPQSPYDLPSSPQSPYNPSSTPQSPYNPSSPPESPYSPSSSPQSPYNLPSSPQPPFNPASSPQSPYNTPSSPQSPYNPPSSPQSPYNPSSSPQSPYNPSSSPQSPYNPSSSPQSPYNPSSSPQSPFPSEESGPSQIPFVPSTGIGYPSPPESPTGPVATGFLPVDNNIDTDEAHPPHIHQINVQCAKDMMTIDIEFNRPFNGIIYSKGFYNSPECRYVNPNSGQTKYSFTVQLNSCGTQFIDQFSEGKQAYLENVLVLQNEPGIQEVWDTIRSVRCLWEGSLNKALSVALSVGMLSQEIVTFSGDTATAKLDIQLGRGPFATAANGLVKIGETMTLVVTVEGDPGFNILVRQCVARDSDPTSGNVVQLTDDRGCVVKPKLMGAFQTTRNPDTNAVIAYAFFQAFKFPDVMDLTIECNVELCKTECAPCSDVNQKLEPGRRRRNVDNATVELTDPVTVGRRLRVFLPEDLEQTGQAPAMVINVGSSASPDSVCLSSSVFLLSSGLLLTLLAASCICSAVLWLKMQHQTLRK